MSTAEEQERDRSALVEAAGAAAAGDVRATLEALHRARVTDGLVRQLRARWPGLHETDTDFIVGEAIDAFYAAVRAGKQVADVAAYVWKIADHMASDHHARRQREASGGLEEVAVEVGGAGPAIADDRAGHRREALAHARRLLPRLGQENVQRVMGYVLDAVERGAVDLPNAEVAEALGISLETVRTSLSRGFRRLAREAQREGLAAPGFEPALGVAGGADEQVEG